MGEVTQAVVLAAGRGSRLENETPKPLFPVLGLPLLARTLFTLQEGGIEEAVVVLGYEAERIRSEMEKIRRLRIKIRWVENSRWEEPNGVSVLAAEPFVEGPFALTMSDHVFQREAVELLAARSGEDIALALVVDRDIDGVNDLDDATKVRLDGERIVEIGKDLERFDAVDTGVFLAEPALFDALREAGPAPSLSEGVQVLARRGAAVAVDGTGLRWQDVDTGDDVRAAERALMARWPKPSDGPVARRLNRKVSTAITRMLVHTSITPNQISVSTLVVSLFAAWAAAMGGYGSWLLAGFLFQFASILDGVDGELALLTFQSSRRGEWIDTLCDSASYIAVLVGLIIGVERAGMSPVYFWGGIVGAVGALLSVLNINAYLLRERNSGSAHAVEYGYQNGDGFFHRVMQVLHYLGRRDLFSFLGFLLAVMGQLPLALPLFGVGATLFLLPATTQANLSSYLRRRRQRSIQRA
ncbi:MAG: NTP transferase domain-containing protein [Gemmatimonadota bacterium]